MVKMEKNNFENISNQNIGMIFRELEEIEHFYPCFKTMIKKE